MKLWDWLKNRYQQKRLKKERVVRVRSRDIEAEIRRARCQPEKEAS